MSAPNLPNALLKFGLALAKHYVKKVIGDEALQEIATTAADISGEEVKAKVDSILGNKEGEKQLLKAAKAADKNFVKKCKDKDFRELFTMEHGDLPSVQTAIANLPKELDDEALRETLFKVFRSELPKRVSDEQVEDGVDLYVKCLKDTLLPVKDFGLHVLYSELKEIGKDVKDVKAGVDFLVENAKNASQGATDSKNYARFLVPFPHNPDFVGRDSELSSLHEMLQQGQSIVGIRPTVLVGLGGIGKTQLAVEYAHAYRDDYPNGVFWLNAIEPLANEFARLAKQLELANADTPLTVAAQRCYEYLNTHTDALVVFDNVEEPSSLNVPFAEGLIAANLKCATLFTTRKRDFPTQFQSFEVKTLPEAAAMQLLLKHPSRQPILEPNHPDHGLARVICIVLGYLPLALALAAAYLGKHAKISLYDYHVRILEEGAMDVVDATQVRPEEMPTRHQTAVNATLKTSWDAITDENARLAFRASGQFRQAEMIPNGRLGLVTGLAMQAKPAYPVPLDEALDILHTASLIEELDESRQRLRLHPLVQEFAAQLSQPEFRLEMAERVATTLSDLAHLHERVVKYGVDFVLEDLRVGLGLSVEKHESEMNTQIARLEHVLDSEVHHLRAWNVDMQPGLLLQQFRNRALELRYDDLMRRAETQLEAWKHVYLREQFPVSRESNALVRTFDGHTGSVNGVAVTADGQWAVSAPGYRDALLFEDRTLKVWDLSTGQCVRTLEGHNTGINDVAVTADGRWAVSASSDKTLKVWDLSTGQCVRTLEEHTDDVNTVAVTADGRWVVSASSDKTLKVWDLTTGRCVRTLEGHTGSVNGVAVTADGRWAVSASSDNTLKVWDLTTGQCVRTLKGHSDRVSSVTVTMDGQWAISASGYRSGFFADQTLKVWDLSTGRCVRTLRGHSGVVLGVAVTADGRWVVSASSDKTLKVWDLSTGHCVRTLEGHTGSVNGVAVTADGRWAVSASSDQTLKVWDLSTGHFVSRREGHTTGINDVVVTADGRWVVSASSDNTLKVWDLTTGQCVRTLKGHTGSVNGVAVTADGRRAVSASYELLKVWNLTTGQCVRTLKAHPKEGVNDVAVTPDGRWAVSASSDKTLRVWDLTTGRCVLTLEGHPDGVRSVAVTMDGQWVISASGYYSSYVADQTLKVWDLSTAKCVSILEKSSQAVNAVAVTADGHWAVSASEDKTLKCWNLSTGQCVRILKGHTNDVYGVAVTADGRRAVSASQDRMLKVWDLTTGECILTLLGTSEFECCAVAPDGKIIVAGDKAGALHFIEWVKFDS